MDSRSRLLTLIAATVFGISANVFADDTPSWGVDARVRLAERYEEQTTGKKDFLRAQVRLNGWVNISADGCLKARGRISSGTRFNNEFIQTGIGDEDAKFQVGVRHLYLDANCFNSKNIRTEVGTLPARAADGRGDLGLAEVGWIDGVRVTIKEANSERDIMLTAGQITDADNPNVLTRRWQGINFTMLEAVQKVSANTTLFGSAARFGDRTFTRAGAHYVVTNYIKWMKQVGLEILGSDAHFAGAIISSDFDLGQSKVRVFATRLNPKMSDREKLTLVLKNNYGFGNNAYFELTRDVMHKRMQLTLRGRAGKAGKLLEAGMTIPFKR